MGIVGERDFRQAQTEKELFMHPASSASHSFLCTATVLLIGGIFAELADLAIAADALTPLDLRGESGR